MEQFIQIPRARLTYERADPIMDSGASASTIPSSIANGLNMQQHPGKVYYSASGHQVVEKGTKVVKCAFQNGNGTISDSRS